MLERTTTPKIRLQTMDSSLSSTSTATATATATANASASAESTMVVDIDRPTISSLPHQSLSASASAPEKSPAHSPAQSPPSSSISSNGKYQPLSIETSSVTTTNEDIDRRRIGSRTESRKTQGKSLQKQYYQAVVQAVDHEVDHVAEEPEPEPETDGRGSDGLIQITHTPTSSPPSPSPPSVKLYGSFWCLGLLNNASYVIMIAAAKNISEGGTALVFLANVLPALAIKGTAPYWFDGVPYQYRLLLATLCMCLCFALVASSSTVSWQLLGVAFASTQGGLGEASLLALAGKVDGANTEKDHPDETMNGIGDLGPVSEEETCILDEVNIESEIEELQTSSVELHESTPVTTTESATKPEGKGRCLTSFSSGTGAAGVFGFCWKWLFNDFIGLSLSATMLLALLSLPLAYWTTFSFVLKWQEQHEEEHRQLAKELASEGISHSSAYHDEPLENDESFSLAMEKSGESLALTTSSALDRTDQEASQSNVYDMTRTDVHVHDLLQVHEMTVKQRFNLVVTKLWPYMTPLFVVYVAEYTLQSGTWTAIGFPVTDKQSRNRFFVHSNWMYQLGVFLSRSSGTIFTAPMSILWLMPILQVANVFLYWHVAATAPDDDDSDADGFIHRSSVLYVGALYAGLLGGGVYIHGYKRICKDIPLQYREWALASTSVAESLGIVVADFLGLAIQSCLYKIHGLGDQAVMNCPF